LGLNGFPTGEASLMDVDETFLEGERINFGRNPGGLELVSLEYELLGQSLTVPLVSLEGG